MTSPIGKTQIEKVIDKITCKGLLGSCIKKIVLCKTETIICQLFTIEMYFSLTVVSQDYLDSKIWKGPVYPRFTQTYIPFEC